VLNRIFLASFLATVVIPAVSPAATINATSTDSRTLSISGTAMEFKYTTGGAGAGKRLLTAGYLVGGSLVASQAASPATSVTAAYSAQYLFNFNTGISNPSTVTAATLDIASAVTTAMSLNAGTFEGTKSSSTDSACGPSGDIDGHTGNCTADPYTNSVTNNLPKIYSITVGTATHAFAGGILATTLGQVNFATLSNDNATSGFLVQLGNGSGITIAWSQLVDITGGVNKAIGATNMTCANCTVYYAVTSNASQAANVAATFKATLSDPVQELPEPSTWLAVASGLALLGTLRRRR
jgi:hypothetical protein